MQKDKDRLGSLMAVIGGAVLMPPPIWLMRQAGRYLPEYREVRAKAGGFVELCLTPKWAAKVTLQPVQRFRLDAAILFSDILIVPYALGVKLWFEENEGPRLDPVQNEFSFGKMLEDIDKKIVERVYETIGEVRRLLADNIALIGFCGAPWTVATYLIAGGGRAGQYPAMELAQRDPSLFERIIGRLTTTTAEHLVGQLRAGADVVQIFDTWAGALAGESFERWCVGPVAEIVGKVRAAVPGARVIVFAKGVGLAGVDRLAEASGADAVGLDWTIDGKQARERLDARCAIQGNLDPGVLVEGGAALDRAVDEVLEAFRGSRHIFNLGHGIRPETPITHVERMIARVREST